MKLAKLSLAAIVAAGALTTVSAQPLEEAIKGVDFTGMVRYRMDDVNQGSTNTNTNDFDVLGKITAPVTDNIKFVGAFATAGGDTDNHSAAPGVNNLDLRKMFFVYKQDALTVKAGLQAIATPITDGGFNGDKGDGVVAMYNAGAVTLVGMYFGNSNTAAGEDITVLAATGSLAPVTYFAWYASVDNAVDSSIGLDLKANFGGLSLWGQVIQTTLDEDQLAANAEDTGMWYALQAGYTMDNFSINAGYIKNDEDQGVNALTIDGGGQIMPGWRMIYAMGNQPDATSMFVDAGVKFGKFGVKLGYATAEIDVPAVAAVAAKNVGSFDPVTGLPVVTVIPAVPAVAAINDTGIDEIWGQVSYKVSKNLNTYVNYSVMSYDQAGVEDKEHMRFEAKYSF